IKGSGPRGRIVKADLEGVKPGSAHAAQAPKPLAGTAMPVTTGPDAKTLADAYGMEYEEIPNNNIKKITAKRLLESKQSVPHFYLTVECQLHDLLAVRQRINDKANGEYKMSVNDMIIKASAMTLQSFPAANVSWTDN